MDFNADLLNITTPEAGLVPGFSQSKSSFSNSTGSVSIDLSRTSSYVSNDVQVNVNLTNDSNRPDSDLNPYELWLKAFNERIEKLKLKETQDIENRFKTAAQELEQWHNDRKKQIEDKLKKLLEEEPKEKDSQKNEFDWIETAKCLQRSEFFIKDQSGGQNQKLIELIVKKRKMLENANQTSEPTDTLLL